MKKSTLITAFTAALLLAGAAAAAEFDPIADAENWVAGGLESTIVTAGFDAVLDADYLAGQEPVMSVSRPSRNLASAGDIGFNGLADADHLAGVCPDAGW